MVTYLGIPDTPVLSSELPAPSQLRIRLEDLLRVQEWRCRKYGKVEAEEWPISRTPPEIRQHWDDEQKKIAALLEAPTPPESTMDDLNTLTKHRDVTQDRSSSQPTICNTHRLFSTPDLHSYTPPSSSERQFPPSIKPGSQHQPAQPLINCAANTRAHNLRKKTNSSSQSGGVDVKVVSRKRRYSEIGAETEQAGSDTNSGPHSIRQKAQENDGRNFRMGRLRQTPSLEHQSNSIKAKKPRRNRITKPASRLQDFSSFSRTNDYICQHT